MPIPLALGAAAAVAGAYGVKKANDARKDNNKAEDFIEEAKEIFEEEKEKLEDNRDKTQNYLEKLGQTKLEAWDEQISRFVNIFSLIKNVNLEDNMLIENINDYDFSDYKYKVKEMKDSTEKVKEVLSGGVQALGSGALVGAASYGGVAVLGSATTGTAIANLSGVAASNATLAWLGGGSLAAGGLGTAGGVAVLGGLVAGPALAVGGMVFSSKARKKLAKAKEKYAEAEKQVEEMKSAISMLKAIQDISSEFNTNINKMTTRLDKILNILERELEEAEEEQSIFFKLKRFVFGLFDKEVKLDYESLNKERRKLLMLSYQFAEATKILLETPLLDEDGKLREDSKASLQTSQKFLQNSPDQLIENSETVLLNA